MLRLVCVSVCLSVVAAFPQVVYPPGLDPASCPNFPYCGPTPLEVPQVPGLAAHAAAEAQVRAAAALQVPGLSAHAAAEAQVRAAQAQVGNQFTGLVGASGNIGPSGLCGPSGCVAF